MRKNFKGFTLVELLVAMAIFAVLVALAIGGVTLAQRAARDAQRRDALKTINLNIADLYGSTSDFPATSGITSNTAGTVLTLTVGSTTKTVDLAGNTRSLINTATASTTNGTSYCYVKTSSGYTLGGLLEDGTWDFSLSTTTPKPANASSLGSTGCTVISGSTVTQ